MTERAMPFCFSQTQVSKSGEANTGYTKKAVCDTERDSLW